MKLLLVFRLAMIPLPPPNTHQNCLAFVLVHFEPHECIEDGSECKVEASAFYPTYLDYYAKMKKLQNAHKNHLDKIESKNTHQPHSFCFWCDKEAGVIY